MWVVSWFIDVSSQQHRLLWKRNALSEGALRLKAFNPEQQSVSYSDRCACFPPVDRVEEGNRWVLAVLRLSASA